jgi:hypothetical protein
MKTIMLTAACLTAATGLSATPATRPPGTARQLPVAYDCQGWHQGQIEMAAFAISCFGSVLVKVPGWAYWTPISARSSGATLEIDTCQPNCESGKFRKYAATVIFYRVRSHDGRSYYSRFKLAYRHDGARSYTYRWARYSGATIPVWVGGPSGKS